MEGGDDLKHGVNYDYINRFSSENYDRITILVPKGGKARIQEAAKMAGMTTSDYIVSLIPESLVGEWKKKQAIV